MGGNKIVFLLVFAVAFLALTSGAEATYWIYGTVHDAADGTPADGHTAIIYLPGDEANYASDTIGPTGESGASNQYMCDAEAISGYTFNVGDEINVKVIDTGDGYTAGPVSVTISGDGVDGAPDMTLQVPVIPVADAGLDQVVDEDTVVNFDGSNSTGAVNYSWDFDASDGIQEDATGVTANHIYADPGIYVVTLTINGGVSSDTLNVTVNDITPPIANAGSDQAISNGTVVHFNGTGSTDNVGIIKYSWDFDASDGIHEDATGPLVTHIYPISGTYTATLTVFDAAGNNDTDTVNISVVDVVADAGPDQVVDEDTVVNFDGSNSIGAVNYSWDFDASDGIQENATGVTANHIYADPGIYTVTLTINYGVISDTLTVTVNDTTPPIANAGPDQIVLNGTVVNLNGTGSTDNVGITNYSWDFDASDGIQEDATGPLVTHLYPTFGTYTATLAVFDAAGNNATDTVNINVVPSVAPIGLTAVLNTDKTVTLTWTESLSGNFSIYASNTPGVSLVTPIATGYGNTWTDANAGSYSQRYYKVKAKGIIGSETIGKYDINLIKKPGGTGKNWISVPENPAITNASSLIQAIGSNCTVVNRWNRTEQKSEGLISLPFGHLGTNFDIIPYEGYEVSVKANITFTVVGIMGY